MEKNKKYFSLFIVGQLITFLFIILLQLLSRNLFVVLLILMHLGIVFIIISKKRFLKQNLQVNLFYKRLYVLLTPFLPMVFYKLLSYVIHYEVNQNFVFIYTMIVAAITFSLSILNTVKFYAFIKQRNEER